MSKKKILLIVLSSVVILSLAIGITLLALLKDNGDWVVITQPTCETPGVQERTNSKGKTETQEIPALGHDYKIDIKNPSCTSDGFSIYDCSRCDSTYISDFQNALGHTYGDWTTAKKATCTSSGFEKHSCTLCGESDRRILKAPGHSYSPILAETIESVIYTTYECEICQATTKLAEGEAVTEVAGNDLLFDVQPSFSFTIKTTKDEDYIRNNLKITDTYFLGTEYEDLDEINIPYTLKKVELPQIYALTEASEEESIWEITPITDYEFDTTYTVSITGDVDFEEYSGEELTFTVEADENHTNKVEYQDNIIFLHALELESPGYYPYLVSVPENSELLYLTVNKADGILPGQILCIGEVTSALEITEDTECDFGKVDSVYPLSTGEWVIILSEPDVGEIFSVLDVSYEDIVDLESGSADMEEIEAELTNSLYTSESFIQFLGSVNVASKAYAEERNLDVSSIASIKDFMNKIDIDPSVRFESNKLIGKLTGYLMIPLKNSNKKEIGNIKVSFSFDIESEFKIDVSYKLKKTKIAKIPYGVKYFDVGLTQTDTVGFDFDISIDIDYSLEEGKYIQNTESEKIHRSGCAHVASVKDTSKLKDISVKNAEKQIREKPIRECKHCQPVQEFNYDLLVLQKERKVIHAYNCTYAAQIIEENREVSEEKAATLIERGYTCCDWCHPDEREIRNYKELIADSLNYSDWQQVTVDISKWAKDAGYEESVRDEKKITGVDITIYGPITASIDIYFVLEFKIEASITYNYAYTQTNTYGMRLQDGRPSPYSTKNSTTLANNLTLMGECHARVGLLVDVNVNIKGLKKWLRAGVTAEVGIYADAYGILYISFVNDDTGENYAAAYFEVGLYLDVEAYYKVFKWKGDIDIYSAKWPVLQKGYDRAYYGYVDPVESIAVDGVYDVGQLLEVKYFELASMTAGQAKLNVAGESGLYTVTLSLADGRYFRIENGKIIASSDAPCEFTDTLIISVKGDTNWKDYVKGSSVFYLKDYEIQLTGKGAVHTEINHVCQICGQTVSDHADENRDHLCDTCGDNIGDHADSSHDGDHGCDYCGEILTTCTDSNSDHICEDCGAVSEHTGGTATCIHKAECSVCGKSYGELDKNNHKEAPAWSYTEYTHERSYNCCGVILVASAMHEWNNGICSECEYPCSHTGGTANCTEQATCTICLEKYGELNENNHTADSYWIKTADTHKKVYSCCEAVVVAEEAHDGKNGICSRCGYSCNHTGGEATCTSKAECTKCGNAYGELDKNNHKGAPVWSYTAHTHEKSYDCCGASIVVSAMHKWSNGVCSECEYSCSHTGGTANCTEQATCTICLEKYGELNANNHTADSRWIKTADTHKKAYSCCNAVVVAEEDHEWSNGTCTECGYSCNHIGGTATCLAQAICDRCGTSYGQLDAQNHTKAPVWKEITEDTHTEAYECCGKISVSTEMHEWENGVCSECNYECRHSGKKATCLDKAICDKCAEAYGETDPNNHVGKPEYVIDGEDGHHKEYNCCGATVTSMTPHTWKNSVCEECGFGCSHSGGTATCVSPAICQKCQLPYGDIDKDHHAEGGIERWSLQTPQQHMRTWSCCNAVSVAKENHEWNHGKCSKCGYVCLHTGGEATCTKQAECSICAELYGNKNESNHKGQPEWSTQTATQHEQTYTCCKAIVVKAESHEWNHGECSECRYVCKHTGGEATCTGQAECSICAELYGNKNESNHKGTPAWSTQTATQHAQTYTCCRKVIVALEDHEWENGACTECGYSCGHMGGKADCQSAAKCNNCGELYGEVDKNHHKGDEEWVKTATTHKKRYTCCDAVIVAEESHEWTIGICTECGAVCEHTGGEATCTGQAECSICTELYGNKNESNHKGTPAWSTQTATQHAQTYTCCRKVIVALESHAWKNGACTECGYSCRHMGGKADCQSAAKCNNCGELYGDIDQSYHKGDEEWVKTATTHKKKYTCCNAVIVAEERHEWNNGVCTECGYNCQHAYREGFCEFCISQDPNATISEGLSFEKVNGGYAVVGIGTCKDTDLVIPRIYGGLPVVSISDRAFWDCSNLKSITIPNGVTSIGFDAFCHCDNLTRITIPNSVTSIGSGAFMHCRSLTIITLPNSITSIGTYVFLNCYSLVSIEIPASVTSIGYEAFSGCSNLTNVMIPASVTNIGDSAFSGCSSLTSITIPASVTSIGASAFSDCSGLSAVRTPSLEAWCKIAFDGYNANPLFYAKNLYNIGNSTTSIKEIVIPNTVTEIKDFAFCCWDGTSVTIPSNITSIGYSAFFQCKTLTNVTFATRSQLTSIGTNAFELCSGLTSIIIPASVTSIGDHAFYKCSSLTSITFAESSKLTNIGEWAFHACSKLTSITIPAGVTSIGNFAFSNCTRLTTITLPASVTSIGVSTFSGCFANIIFHTHHTSRDSVTVTDKSADINQFFDEVSCDFDIKLLQNLGYSKVKLTISLSIAEISKGYQKVWVYNNATMAEKTHLAEISIEHGGTKLETTAYFDTREVKIDIDDLLASNGTIWIEYGADGEKNDDWTLGDTKIILEAIK